MKTALSIYDNSFIEKKHQVLYDSHPLLIEVLGADSFFFLIRLYLRKYDIDSFAPLTLSQNLTLFLRRTSPWKQNAILAEVADLDFIKLKLTNFESNFSKKKFIKKNSVFLPQNVAIKNSLFSLANISSKSILSKKNKRMRYYFVQKIHNRIEVGNLIKIEFIILNWAVKNCDLNRMIIRASKLKITEKKFYKIFYNLKKRGLLQQNISFN